MVLSADQIALLALGVSSFSIVVGVSSFAIQRRHNRLSVRPICRITYLNYANEISVTISNNGVGPLVIKKLWIEKDGKRYDEFNTLVKSVIPGRRGYYRRFIRANGRVVSADSGLRIFSFKRSENHDNYDAARDAARKEIEDTEVFVCYTDIYGQKFPLEARKLVDFAKSRKGGVRIVLNNSKL